MGFLLRITKFSARWAKKRMNFLHKMLSNSSACLMQTLTRMEFTDPSINTRSPLFLLITTGLSSSSLLALGVWVSVN